MLVVNISGISGCHGQACQIQLELVMNRRMGWVHWIQTNLKGEHVIPHLSASVEEHPEIPEAHAHAHAHIHPTSPNHAEPAIFLTNSQGHLNALPDEMSSCFDLSENTISHNFNDMGDLYCHIDPYSVFILPIFFVGFILLK